MENKVIPCVEVLASVVFIIEGAIEEAQNPRGVQDHLLGCPNCQAEIVYEQSVRSLVQEVLKRSCDEKAPEGLFESVQRQIHEQIHEQIYGAAAQEIVTQISVTEISIEIDEFGNVEHREIQIEETHIQSFGEINPGDEK